MKEKTFYEDGTPFSGADTMNLVHRLSDGKILLSFSLGKDSVACWLKLRDRFEIIPYFLYLIPDLDFIEESVQYFEDYFGCHIMRLPHPSLYRMLNNFVFQSPDRVAMIRSAKLPNFDYDMLAGWIGAQHGIDEPWVANGVRAADSPNRRSSIMKHGPITWRRRYFYPVWDMRIDELVGLIRDSGIKLPVDYQLFGRSFDGIDHRFLHIIKKEFPKDYATILEWFPLAEMEVYRYEQAQN